MTRSLTNTADIELAACTETYESKIPGLFDSINRKTAENIAKRYYPVNVVFPKFLASTISHIDNEKTRILLVENLYEEHGNLDHAKTHTELFRIFMRSLGLKPETFAAAKNGTREYELINLFDKTCSKGPDYKALAIMYSFEKMFSPICVEINRRMKDADITNKRSLIFFEEHGEVDIEHAEKLRKALISSIKTRKQLRESTQITKHGAGLMYNLFKSIVSEK